MNTDTKKLRELIRLAEITIGMIERGELKECEPTHRPMRADFRLGNFLITEEKPFGFSIHDY